MAQLSSPFNSRMYTPRVGFPLVPAGRYPLRIVDSVVEANSKGTGGQLTLTLEVMQGQHQGHKIKDRLGLYNNDPAVVQRANDALAAYCAVTGVYDVTETAHLHGIPFQGEISNDGNYNNVRGLFDINGNEPTMGAAGPGQAGGPQFGGPGQQMPQTQQPQFGQPGGQPQGGYQQPPQQQQPQYTQQPQQGYQQPQTPQYQPQPGQPPFGPGAPQQQPQYTQPMPGGQPAFPGAPAQQPVQQYVQPQGQPVQQAVQPQPQFPGAGFTQPQGQQQQPQFPGGPVFPGQPQR